MLNTKNEYCKIISSSDFAILVLLKHYISHQHKNLFIRLPVLKLYVQSHCRWNYNFSVYFFQNTIPQRTIRGVELTITLRTI